MSFTPFAVHDPNASQVHWGLKQQCGICGTQLDKGDPFVALIGSKDGTAFSSRTEVMPFLASASVKSYKGSYMCRWSGCKTCKTSPDVVSVHANCLEVYLQYYASKAGKAVPQDKTTETTKTETAGTARAAEKTQVGMGKTAPAAAAPVLTAMDTEALQRLWTVALWRSPWREAPFLFLFQRDNALEPVHDAAVLRRLGLPGMARMPPEIAMAVSKLTGESSLWNLNAAAGLAQSLAQSPTLLTTVPLLEIEAWERGGEPIRRAADAEKDAAADGVIRFTMDARGLLRIERLSARPAYDGTMSTGKLAYAVSGEKALQGAQVHLQFGLGRIELPAALAGLQIWNTPTPPPIEACSFLRKHPLHIIPSSLLHAIDLEAVVGLTFFCDPAVQAIHAHTAEEPSAEATLARMLPKNAAPIWQYMPLVPGDRIEAVGLRREGYSEHLTLREVTIMFRKHLSGDTLVGFSFYDAPTEGILTQPSEQPRALVYTSCDGDDAMTEIGVYNVPASPDVAAAAQATAVRNHTRRKRFNHSAYPDEQILQDAFQSNAPLAGVTHIQVFSSKTTGLTLGMVLTYENGGQRALGVCRVGTDRDASCDYERPVRLCFTCDEEEGKTRLRVVTEADLGVIGDHAHGDEDEDGDGEGERTCCLLTGRLEWAAADDRFSIVHYDAEESDDEEMDDDIEHADLW